MYFPTALSPGQWRRVGGRSLAHAGQIPQTLKRALGEARPVEVVFVARARERDRDREHLVRVVAGVNAAQADEALEQQPRADEQHERQGDFAHDERAAQATPAAPGRPPAAFFERLGQVRPRRAQGGREPEGQPGQERDREREAEHGRVYAERAGLVEPREVRAAQRGQKVYAPRGEENAEATAAEGQQQTLAQQLARDAPAARAERRADGEFPPPRRGAREQEVRDVGARE